jgi:hypothetical protein
MIELKFPGQRPTLERVTLTHVGYLIGRGTGDDPFRHVDAYFDDEGHVVIEADPNPPDVRLARWKEVRSHWIDYAEGLPDKDTKTWAKLESLIEAVDGIFGDG